jgi:UDP-glucose 4-epimerase
MRILVTGGLGFIGSHLQEKLIKEGYEVAIVDNLRSGDINRLSQKAKFYKVDITDKTTLEGVFKDFNPQVIFHLAAQIEVESSITDPYEDLNINTVGTLNLLELCKKKGIHKFIYSNTGGACYGNVPAEKLPIREDIAPPRPISPYGISKTAAEHYVRLYANLYGFKWVSLRYSNVYGPRQIGNRETGVIAIFIEKLINKQRPIINGKGLNTRDYIYIKDVVDANIKALVCKKSGAFNISTGKETSNIEVFNQIEFILKTGIKPKFGLPRPGDILRSCLSPKKAMDLLNWHSSTTVKNGIEKTLRSYMGTKEGNN